MKDCPTLHKLPLGVKSIRIGIGIGNAGPVFIWFQTDTKICSIAHH